jgi:NADH:ubiquinone oxidoreductase subunit 3 (subunit A)
MSVVEVVVVVVVVVAVAVVAVVVVVVPTLDRREANTGKVYRNLTGLEFGALHAQPLSD